MKKIAYLGAVMLSMTLLFLSCGKDDDSQTPETEAPIIKKVEPNTGPVGTTVVLDGAYFGDTKGDNTVKFNGQTATIQTASTTRLVVTVPNGATTGKITVKVGDKTATSATDFVVIEDGPSAIELDKTSLELYREDTETIVINNIEDFSETAEWETSDANIATVNSEGTITAVDVGVVEVTVTLGDISANIDVTVKPNTYVVGSIDDKAVLWKNGEPTFLLLPEGYNSYSYATDIFVTDAGDVYISGYGKDGQNIYRAMVWINGEETVLNEGNEEALAHAVVVYGSDYYVVGHENNGGFPEAKVWVSGTPNVLEESIYGTYAYGLDVNENGIFAVGYEDVNGVFERAKLWELNGEAILLAESNEARARSIALSGSQPHVTGMVEENGVKLAKHWDLSKELENNLNENLNNAAAAADVFVDGSTVYVVGAETNNGANTATAKLWVDGTPTSLSDDENKYFYTTSVYVDSMDKTVYVVGAKNTDGPNYAALLWIKTGTDVETVNLSGDYENSRAEAVFVK